MFISATILCLVDASKNHTKAVAFTPSLQAKDSNKLSNEDMLKVTSALSRSESQGLGLFLLHQRNRSYYKEIKAALCQKSPWLVSFEPRYSHPK